MKKIKKAILAPSLLSADFSILRDELSNVKSAGADWIHVDVMDGHFVPNITIGPIVVSALSKHTALPLDCHLMVSQPENWIESFAQAGASVITVHIEASSHVHKLIQSIKKQGCLAGVSLNPATSLSAIEEVLPYVDLVLVMSVNPGFGGQKFISSTINKIKKLSKMRDELKGDKKFLIEVDGGVDASNIAQLRKAGCDVFVAGSAIFAEKNRKKAVQKLRKALD